MTRFLLFLFGFILMTVGIVSSILYLNIIGNGYNFLEYGQFIFKRGGCYLILIGLIIINLTLYIRGEY